MLPFKQFWIILSKGKSQWHYHKVVGYNIVNVLLTHYGKFCMFISMLFKINKLERKSPKWKQKWSSVVGDSRHLFSYCFYINFYSKQIFYNQKRINYFQNHKKKKKKKKTSDYLNTAWRLATLRGKKKNVWQGHHWTQPDDA